LNSHLNEIEPSIVHSEATSQTTNRFMSGLALGNIIQVDLNFLIFSIWHSALQHSPEYRLQLHRRVPRRLGFDSQAKRVGEHHTNQKQWSITPA